MDSREQDALPFKVEGNVSEVKVKGMPWADYWCEYETGQEMPISFERKSIPDLYSTLTSGNERFHRELERAKKMDATIFLIVEGSMSEVLKGAQFSQVKPETLLKTLFTFKVKHNLHPVFCNNRAEMKRYILETFEAFGRNFKPPVLP